MSSRPRAQLAGLVTALQFLTTLPVPVSGHITMDSQARSLPWYPLVGLLIGGLLVVLGQWLDMPFYVEAIVLLLAWVALTGALHLDGLADCADAWLGGLGNRERTLELLKDPLCGAMAVVVLVLVLLAKAAALAAIVQAGGVALLLLVPALARASVLLLFPTTDYVRAGGLGEAASRDFPQGAVVFALLVLLAFCLLVMSFALALSLLAVTAVVFAIVRHASLARLGGFTGDIAGAQIELVELALLFTLVASL